MTFPVAAARTTTVDGASTASHAIGLGAPSAGDLLVVFIVINITDELVIDEAASGTGWWRLATAEGFNMRVAAYAKLAEGGDALTLRSSAGVRAASVCYKVTGHGSGIGGGLTASAFSGSGNPPSASFGGAAQDALFITALGTTTSVASAAPSGYASLTTASAPSAFMATAEKTANATSDDPGTFTNTSQSWVATTVAIPSSAVATNARVTQAVGEVVSNVTANLRASQIAAETVSKSDPFARATQVCVEMVSENVPDGLVTAGPQLLFIAT